MQIKEYLKNIEKAVLLLAAALFPIFVLSATSAPTVIPKGILIAGAGALLLILWSFRMIVSGKVSLSVGKFDLGVLLVGAAYLASTFIKVQNKTEAFFFPGTVLFMASAILFYFLLNQHGKKTKTGVLWALSASSLLLSISVIAVELKAFSKILQLPAFARDANFNAFGGYLPSAIFIGAVLSLLISFIVREKDFAKKMLGVASTGIALLALGVSIYRLLPPSPQSPRFMDLQTSWEISVETIKKSPIWGIGPGNYLTAFNLYRPVSYNASDLWNVRFASAGNFYLTMATETGFAGIAAFAVLLASVYSSLFKNFKLKESALSGTLFERASIALLVVLFALFPASPLLMLPFFLILSVLSRSEDNVVEFGSVNSSSRIPAFIIGVPLVALSAAVFVFGSNPVQAEMKYKKSLDALSLNDPKLTYDYMRQAVGLNPGSDRYHASFAQINMAIATSIANKENPTDEDKKTIAQLVGQAISEGKAAVALNPQRSGNWEALANIYRGIMPFAAGADSFAIQSYSQAIALDPVSPNLRIALGGTFYSLGRFDEALEAFKLAVIAKPDLANAHYNLSAAFREKKDYENAISQMNAVLLLVEKDSKDYKLAKSELEALEKNRPVKTPEATENLTPPEPAGEPVFEPPIELPEEASPAM